jgi:predicted PurR-regulated permease PerM
MSVLGLENALFWSLVIFILNYIPIVGGLAAIILPVAFGVMQFESITPILILTIGLVAVQFIIGNTIQPKMMGDSLNLSALVVVLSLTLWYALWGGVGAFLSAPLTVIVMIVFAQFSTTRWLAVLLSADGMPSTGKKI